MAGDMQLLQPPLGGGSRADDGADGEAEADGGEGGGGQEAWRWPWRLWPFNNRALGTATSTAVAAGAGGGEAGGGGAGGGARRSLESAAAPEADRLSRMVARVLGGMLASGAFNTSVCAAGEA